LSRPPRPTACPYTTLFRSYSSLVKNAHDMREHVTVQLASDATRLRKPSNELSSRRKLVLSLVFGVVIVGHLVAITTRRERWPFSDRKSTRLNSSHVKSSYA